MPQVSKRKMPLASCCKFDYHTPLLELCQLLIRNGAYTEAIYQLRHLLRLYPGSLEARRALAGVYVELGDRRNELTILEEIVAINPNDIDACDRALTCALSLGAVGSVAPIVERLIKSFPSHPQVLYLQTRWQIGQGQVDAAFASFRAASAGGLVKVPVVLDLCKLLRNHGRNQEAGELIKLALPRGAEVPVRVNLQLAQLLTEQQQAQDAISILQGVLSRGTPSPDDAVLLSEVLEKLAGDQQAQKFLSDYLTTLGGKPVRRALQRRTGVQSMPSLKSRPVIIVCETPRQREAKIGLALKRTGLDVLLLHSRNPNFDISPYFTETKIYSNADDAVFKAIQCQPAVAHLCSLSGDHVTKAIVEERFCKTVYDTNDIMEGALNECLSQIHYQRYCLENADGLACRDLQAHYTSRLLGYARKGKGILFADYAWGIPEFSVVPRARSAHENLSIVSIGNFPNEKTEGGVGLRDIARRLSLEHGIVFHVYTHWFYANTSQAEFEDRFSEYFEIAAKTDRFKIFKPIPMDQVIPTVAKYDFGFDAASELVHGLIPKRAPYHFRFGGSMRNLDYLDAGVPVIASPGLNFQWRRLAQFGLGVSADPPFLDSPHAALRQVLTPDLPERIMRARARESVFFQIPRLIRFYESL